MDRRVLITVFFLLGFLSVSCQDKGDFLWTGGVESASSSEVLVDIDGNEYPVVRIGDQEWMAANLRVTRLNDGTPIPQRYGMMMLGREMGEGEYVVYDNDALNAGVYGLLYNFAAVMDGRLAPEGWRVPTNEDWQELEVYLGIDEAEARHSGVRGTDQGGKLKLVRRIGQDLP